MGINCRRNKLATWKRSSACGKTNEAQLPAPTRSVKRMPRRCFHRWKLDWIDEELWNFVYKFFETSGFIHLNFSKICRSNIRNILHEDYIPSTRPTCEQAIFVPSFVTERSVSADSTAGSITNPSDIFDPQIRFFLLPFGSNPRPANSESAASLFKRGNERRGQRWGIKKGKGKGGISILLPSILSIITFHNRVFLSH